MIMTGQTMRREIRMDDRIEKPSASETRNAPMSMTGGHSQRSRFIYASILKALRAAELATKASYARPSHPYSLHQYLIRLSLIMDFSVPMILQFIKYLPEKKPLNRQS